MAQREIIARKDTTQLEARNCLWHLCICIFVENLCTDFTFTGISKEEGSR